MAPAPRSKLLATLLFALAAAGIVGAGRAADPEALEKDFEQLIAKTTQAYQKAQEKIAAEKAPLVATLDELEQANASLRADVEGDRAEVSRARSEIERLREKLQELQSQNDYIGRSLDEYLAKFESRIQLAEAQRYNEPLTALREQLENGSPTLEAKYGLYAEAIDLEFERASEAIGGFDFNGRVVDEKGRFHSGRILVLGPSSYFNSKDGSVKGMLRFHSGTLEPQVATLDSDSSARLAALFEKGVGQAPLDPSLGDALTVRESTASFTEHIRQGGFVGYAILLLGGIALIVSLLKLADLRRFEVALPEQMQEIARLALKEGSDSALAKARQFSGVVSEMIATGIRNVRSNAVLLEETMLSVVLRRQPEMERFLPFLAITAAAAPLLGLLGTVVGLIKTFALITVYGAGAPKALSSGISEALVTTELGLMVAIPTLILHGLFSRQIKTRLGTLEQTAFDFVKAVSLHREEASPEKGE